MTKKQIKEHEKYLSSQSRILNESLDFWQVKALEQISFCEGLDRKSQEDLFDGSDDEVSEGASQELNYYMMKLSWENRQLNILDSKIKTFLKDKKV